MHIEIGRHCLVHMPEKRQEFLMSVARLTLRYDFTRCRIERGERSSSAMPDVIMRYSLEVAQPHRQHRLRTL
jgi:hypothetical protein